MFCIWIFLYFDINILSDKFLFDELTKINGPAEDGK